MGVRGRGWLLAVLIAGAWQAEAKGGGHSVFVPIIVPGTSRTAVGPYQPPTSLSLSLEILDSPAPPVEGVIGLHQALARHTIRAADGIVLDQAVRGHRRLMPAGTVLVKVVWREMGQETVLWCDMTTNHGFGGDVAYDCLSSAQGDGKLTKLWSAQTSDEFLGFGGDEIVRSKGAVDPPLSFHAASAEQRPMGLIGYEWCGGDNFASPARFEVSASFNGGFWEDSESHACPFGAWPNPSDKAEVQIDTLRVRLSPGPSTKTLAYRLEGRIAPGPIARLEPGGPIQPMAIEAADLAVADEDMSEPALVPTGDPAIAAQGEVTQGETLYSISVKHGLTGVLANDIWLGKYTLFGHAPPASAPSLKTGQIVYARRADDGVGTGLVWCAPRKSEAGVWADAVCFPSDGTGYIWVVSEPALLIGDLMMPGSLPPYVTPPEVHRGPVDLPPMTLSYVFQGWGKATVKIDGEVDWGDGPHKFKSWTVKVGPGGAALIAVNGGKLLLRPGSAPDLAQMMILTGKPKGS